MINPSRRCKVRAENEKTISKSVEKLAANLTSPNVMDSNFEQANIVDVLNRLASAVFLLAKAVDKINDKD
jgi:hypothetical protein